MNFREWLINEATTLDEWVKSFMGSTPDFSTFLVFADWLEERGDPLADIIRNYIQWQQSGNAEFRRMANHEAAAHEDIWPIWSQASQQYGTLPFWNWAFANIDGTLSMADVRLGSDAHYVISPKDRKAYYFEIWGSTPPSGHPFTGEVFNRANRLVATVDHDANPLWFVQSFGPHLEIPLHKVPEPFLKFFILRKLPQP